MLVGRDPERVKSVADEAMAAGGGVRVDGYVADLELMSNVRVLADEIRGRYEHVDVLANNAGALFRLAQGDPGGIRADVRTEPSGAVPAHPPAARSGLPAAVW